MTTDELITRARRAIETGQPNLAKLYMRKALEQTEQHRRQLDPWRALRANLQAFSDGLQGIVKAYVEAVEPVAQMIADSITPAIKAVADGVIAPSSNSRRNDFTLAGPGK